MSRVSAEKGARLKCANGCRIYLGIDAGKMCLTHRDIEEESGGKLMGGFWYGVNRRRTVYIPPRPLLNHGVHRYFFDVVGLKERLRRDVVLGMVGRDVVSREIEGRVACWGRWIGEYERRWE